MIQFAEVFPEEKTVISLIRELSRTHFLQCCHSRKLCKASSALSSADRSDSVQNDLNYLRWPKRRLPTLALQFGTTHH